MSNMRKCVQIKLTNPYTKEIKWKDTEWTDIKAAQDESKEADFGFEYRQIFIVEESEPNSYPLDAKQLFSPNFYEDDQGQIIQCISDNPLNCYNLTKGKVYFMRTKTKYKPIKDCTYTFTYTIDKTGRLEKC